MPSAPVLSGPFLRVTLANFFFFLNFASFFLLPLHITALGGDETTVGAVMGAAGLAGLVVLPVIGATIDRYGRRRFLILGSMGMMVATACYLAIDEIGAGIYALRLWQGVSFAAAFTGATTLAAELAPPARRAQALGIFGISTLSTHAIAPAVGEEIVRHGGFPALFAVGVGLSMVAVVFAWSVPLGSGARHGPEVAARDPWRMGRLEWVLAGTMVSCGLAFGAVLTFIPTFIRASGLGRVGTFFGVYTGAAVLTRVVGGGLSDAVGRRAVILPTLVMLAGAVLFLAFVRNIPMLALGAALFGLAQGMSYPTLNALAVDVTSDAHLGRVQALFNGAFNLGVTGSAFAFGAVAARFGYRPMFTLAALTPLLGWVLFYVATRGEAALAPGSPSPPSGRPR